ncbi:MAG: TonB-dependent receptor plug domain-containing protein [Marinilabiliaceae bacterium]|nr:TonB-dependent receptor plug domain-containing protein [Marinilabiliaceae bacterium]
MRRFLILILVAMLTAGFDATAQNKLTKEQVLNMSMTELSDLSLEDLMEAVNLLGVSSINELFAMIMNKSVSSATKTEETAFTSPLSSTVITKAEMRSYGVTTIEEAFRMIPGAIVIEKTNGVYQIIIRGLNNIPDNNLTVYTETSNILLMIDGRICNDISCGVVTLENLPIGIEDVERIEVVRGASSALYGPNAVQGVINIITEKPNESSNHVQGSFQIGNQNTAIADVAFRIAPNSKLALGLTGNIQYRQRDTRKLYIAPSEGLVYVDNNGNPFILDENGNPQLNLSPSLGGWYTTDEIQNNIKQAYTDGNLYDIFVPEAPMSGRFRNPALARKSVALNGYIALTPAADIRFDITGGYYQSHVANTPYTGDNFSFNQRQYKGGYANLNSSIYGVALNASFNKWSGDYNVGDPGLWVHPTTYTVSASYDIKPVEGLSIRPEVSYLHYYAKDHEHKWIKDEEGNDLELSGFFNDDASNSDFGLSLRADYKTSNKWRFIGAFRSDKTDLPDKWNHSWQFAVSKELNENNFIRLSYGRAMRSMVMMNAKSSYNWKRTNMLMPNYLQYSGNPNAKLQYSDAVELGYRWRPTSKILLDAETYYNYSTDYGSLQAKQAMLMLKSSDLQNLLGLLITTSMTNPNMNPTEMLPILAGMEDAFMTKAYIEYKNVPYKVHQIGLSLNMDYIISSKLIAKLNLNVQNTKINDYYEYKQSEGIATQLYAASVGFLGETDPEGNYKPGAAIGLFEELVSTVGGIMATQGEAGVAQFVAEATSYSPVNLYSSDDITALMGDQNFLAAVANGENWTAPNGKDYEARSLYFGLKYKINLDSKNDTYYFGSKDVPPYELQDGHKHKDTPNVYGMIGLMYKPTDKLNVSAFANYIGEYNVTADQFSEPLKTNNRFTMNLKVGFLPVKGCEVFFNAHNLFNNRKQEFANSDIIGGLYTFGVNFGF